MRKFTLVCSLLATSAISLPAMAATATGNLTVTATVQESCLVGTDSGAANDAALNFGTISSTVAANDADTASGGTALSVLCSNGTTYSVWADNGSNASSSQRRMIGSLNSEFLPYDLYTSAARTTAFPSSASNTAVSGSGNGSLQTINIYGRIPAGTSLPAADSYLDTVVLTVVY